MHFSKSTKIILLLIALFVVLLAVYLTYSVSSQPQTIREITLTPDSIPADWKTCRNVEAGYEIKYPKEWYVYGEGSSHSPGVLDRTTECIGTSVFLTTQPPSRMRPYQIGDFRITIGVDDESYIRSLNGVKELSPKTDSDLLKAWLGEKNVIGFLFVDGISFTLFDYGDVWLATIHNNMVYRVLLQNDSLNTSIIKNIVSSFRFLD